MSVIKNDDQIILTDKYNNVYYYNNNMIAHRTDGPAIVYVSGDLSYIINGKYHRENGPAKITHNSIRKEWWHHGKLHRIDGPAIEDAGTQEWYFDGQLHRLDGPAKIYSNLVSQEMYWWYKGQCIPCNNQKEFEQKIKLLAFL